MDRLRSTHDRVRPARTRGRRAETDAMATGALRDRWFSELLVQAVAIDARAGGARELIGVRVGVDVYRAPVERSRNGADRIHDAGHACACFGRSAAIGNGTAGRVPRPNLRGSQAAAALHCEAALPG